MTKIKILVRVIFSLCCVFVLGFGSNEADLDSMQLKNVDPDQNTIPTPIKHLPSLVEGKIQEQEKAIEELKEQMKLWNKKFDELSNKLSSHLGDSFNLTDLESLAESCILEEKWVTVHEHNNTSPSDSDVKAVVTVTVGLKESPQDSQPNQNLTSSGNFLGNSHRFLQAENFARMGKSKSTGFDWTHTPFFLWTRETPVTKTYTCHEGSYCVYKQLVGQCGKAQVPVDEFCQISVPLGNPIPENCADSPSITSCMNAMEMLPSSRPAKQRIYPNGNTMDVKVLCDFETDGGGWTIIQKRSSGSNFYRTWDAYVEGFGSVDGNVWLGLDNIHALTKHRDQELRIELEDFDGRKKYAKYSSFSISDASDSYQLSVSGFSEDSTAGDSMSYHDGMQFSTYGKDNDHMGWSCAEEYQAGWWFKGCLEASLNGPYRKKGETFSNYKGIIWSSWKGISYSLAKTEMKIRKRI